jgi:DNA-nicking Smr family endonuclease
VGKLKLDLHPIHNKGGEIEKALRDVIDEAVRTRATLVEIIPGKGSGQLKKHVLRFLEQKEIKSLYHRVEKDSDNFGRVFVHFRWSGASSASGHRAPATPRRGRSSGA